MAISLAFNLLLLTVIGCCDLVFCYKHVISIDASNGHDDSSCLQPSGPSCQTLEYVQKHLKSVTSGSVEIEVCQPGINLTKALNFTNITNLAIVGTEYSNRIFIQCNTSGSGLTFINVTGLSLNYIQLFGCGAERDYSVSDMSTEVSALALLNCRDVNITNTLVQRSNGTGMLMVNTYGNVLIDNTTVLESYLKGNSSWLVYGGSGLSIQFNPCPLTFSHEHQENANNSAHGYGSTTYTISNLLSAKNRGKATKNQKLSCGQAKIGGGASIVLGGNTANVNISISDSTFKDNYVESCGAGLLILLYNSSNNNRISVVGATIENNTVGSREVGGGLQIFYSACFGGTTIPSSFPTSTLEFVSCKFDNNRAYSGGGVNIYSNQLPDGDDKRAVHFINCSWTGNTASRYGAAVHIMAGVLVSGVRIHYHPIVFTDCKFVSNKIVPETFQGDNLQVQINGGGALFSNVVPIIFGGNTTFNDSNGTALWLSSSIASFHGGSQVLFQNNSGNNGGAVSLVGRSYLYLNGSSNFSFINNRAKHLGGAIYSISIDSILYQPCFIDHVIKTNKSVFTFSGNHAGDGRGHHIFVSSLYSCKLYCSNGSLDCIGVFTFSDPQNKTTATLPSNFSLSTKHVSLFPGLTYKLPLLANDSEGNKVPDVSYQASIAGNDSAMWVDPAYVYVSANNISVLGEPGENGTLRLDALSTETSLLVEIVLEECPPGYVLSDSECICSASTYYGLLKCDPEAYIRYGVWMGECDNPTPCTADCPVGFCSYNTTDSTRSLYHPLPMEVDKLEEAVCSPTRTGTICGSCIANHSVYYNSWYYHCGKEDNCSLGPLYFLLSTIAPLTCLFLVITLLDANFASDWNGFLLFTQVVHNSYLYGNGTIRLPHALFQTLGWFRYVYGIFNLEFFQTNVTAFCIWKGANVMDIMMVKLGSICFALSLVLLTVCMLKNRRIVKYFPCLLRRRYSVVNGISAFFILCYAQCVNICFKVLVSTCIFDKDHHCLKYVILHSGNMEPFKGEHLKYGMIAIVFLLFIVALPPVLLLFYPLFFRLLGLCSLSESPFAIRLWRLMPIQLLDSVQNPFRDNCRFFAGLYFLYRVLIPLLDVTVENLVEYYAGVELILLVIIVLHAAFQPYKSRVRNIVDLLLFFNLALLNGVVEFMYVSFANSKVGMEKRLTFLALLQIVQFLLPLLCLAVYLIARSCVHLKKKKGYRVLQMSHTSQ
jgi:predicted outer membrane repeat protein